jgi:isoleucyl-tRNA synthetase
MAPILSFTADELWRFLPGARDESVHLATFPTAAELDQLIDHELVDRWTRLIGIRQQVLARIEPLRKDKQIGTSLQARVVLTPASADLDLLVRHESELPMLFIVSDVVLAQGAGDPAHPPAEGAPDIAIARAAGVKCERCWRYVAAVSSEPAWAGVCARCQDALAETVHG